MNVLKLSWVIGLICSFLLGVCAQGGPLAPASKESAPNPIADVYPNGITGTFNSTMFVSQFLLGLRCRVFNSEQVVPIPFKLARSIVPKQWAINRKAYCKCRSFPVLLALPECWIIRSPSHSIMIEIRNTDFHWTVLPGFPDDSYPLLIRSGVDHDVGVRELNFKLVRVIVLELLQDITMLTLHLLRTISRYCTWNSLPSWSPNILTAFPYHVPIRRPSGWWILKLHLQEVSPSLRYKRHRHQ